MIIFGIVLVSLLILIAIFVYLYIQKTKLRSYNKKTKQMINEILAKRSFKPDSMLFASKELFLALNDKHSKIAVIENFNPDIEDSYRYYEIAASKLLNIEANGLNTKVNFHIAGSVKTIIVPSFSKEAKEFCHGLLAKILYKKLELKCPEYKFSYWATSDYECAYIWAYDPIKCSFAYYSPVNNHACQVINLRQEFFTIDTNYEYLELPVMGKTSQILLYEKNFIYNLFSDLYENISTHISPVWKDNILYDSYSEILYLTNGSTSLQSIIIDKIEDVFYRENRLQFTLKSSAKIINFIADKNFIEEFEKFVVNYNLRQIANSFDYKLDKLINVNTSTKFIIDVTRDRVVYCANLNKFYGFSYMTIAFSNLKSAEVIKNSVAIYVRIKTHDDDILDVTCLKTEVAYYVKAQIDCIIMGELPQESS